MTAFSKLPKAMSITKTAKLFGVSRQAVYDWKNAGLIEVEETEGKHPKIKREALLKATFPREFRLMVAMMQLLDMTVAKEMHTKIDEALTNGN